MSATVLIVPGLRDHVAQHWQTLLAAEWPGAQTVPPMGREDLDCAHRVQAIEAAELSKTANERSFKGGVRTRIDVLNSVQVLFSTREEYLNTIVRLTRNHFALSRNSATPVAQTISELQPLLF